MTRTLIALSAAGLFTFCFAVADDVTPPAPPPNAADSFQAVDELDRAEEQAGIELAVAKIKLELVRAKKDLRAGQTDAAVQRARLVLALAGSLPPEIDLDDYTLPAEGILARAGALPAGSAGSARQHVARPPRSAGFRENLNADALATELERRRAGRAYASTGTIPVDEWIAETDDLDQVPLGDIQYPENWAEKVARREKYAGGEIARSQSWYDADGREWFTAVYDIGDLTFVPLDFQPSFTLDPVENLRNGLDRHALRWGYGIFGGYHSWDLDTLFQLFRAFGGMDDDAWHGPMHSKERQRQIVDMIQRFTIDQPPAQPQIISLEP